MEKIGYYIFTGFKANGTKCEYKIYEYDIYNDYKVSKKIESLNKKIINTLSNKKKFIRWSLDYKEIR